MKEGEFQMRVRVDEARDNGASRIDDVSAPCGKLSGPTSGNAVPFHSERAVADWRRRRRTYPIRLIDDHVPNTCVRTVTSLEEGLLYLVPDTGLDRLRDPSFGRDDYCRINNLFSPVPLARRDIARQ